jgi:hypothetical protein
MSLYYRYTLVSKGQPALALGGRFVRPRPIVSVALIGPQSTVTRDALLDPGADDTVFPDRFAPAIGLDLTNAPSGMFSGAGSSGLPVRYAQVTLRLTDGREQREWPAWVGFTSARLTYPMLGFAGCLQFFDATFRGAREDVELTPNGLYPGT